MTKQATTADALQVWTDTIRQTGQLSDQELMAGFALTRVQELARGEYLLRAGAVARDFAIVTSGLLREYFVLADGTERSKAFIPRGEPTGSLADLISGQPSRAFIVAVEPSRILVARYAEYTALVARSQAWQRVHAALLERMFLRKAEREYELIALDAEARFEALLTRIPDIEEHVAGKNIASYLAITPEYLSRLRRRRRDKRRARSKNQG